MGGARRGPGTGVGWASEGNLHLGYTREEMQLFERWSREARALDLDTEVVGRDDALELFPGLEDDFVGGIFSPLDGGADPHRAAPAIAEHAASKGARIVTGCAVTAIETAEGGIRAVVTEQGKIETRTLVVAAGAWSSRLLWPLGLRLPQRRIHATVAATAPGTVSTRRIVWARHLAIRPDHEGSYILAGGGGRVPLDLETVRYRDAFEDTDLDTDRREEVTLESGAEVARDLRSLQAGQEQTFWSRVRAEEPAAETGRASGVPTIASSASCRRLPGGAIGRSWAGYIDYTPDAVPRDRPPRAAARPGPGHRLQRPRASPWALPVGCSQPSWRSRRSPRWISIRSVFPASPTAATSDGCTSRSVGRRPRRPGREPASRERRAGRNLSSACSSGRPSPAGWVTTATSHPGARGVGQTPGEQRRLHASAPMLRQGGRTVELGHAADGDAHAAATGGSAVTPMPGSGSCLPPPTCLA